ncbi:MAG TPA: FG-GAP-like repeat-containing protein, partial [Verrucomicrobiae bacterium]
MNLLQRRYLARGPLLLACATFLEIQCAFGTPSITQQPSPATNSASLGVSLTNRVSASSPLGAVTYQWRLDGIDLSGATNSTLSLTNIRAAQAGRYTAVATDAQGSMESAGWGVHVDAAFERIMSGPMLNVSGVGAAWADYDRDGFPDLYVGTTVGNPTAFGANVLYRNQGNGTFAAVNASVLPAGGGAIAAAWADYDNDGWLDLFGAKLSNDLLYRNNGDGTFTAPTNPLTTSGGSTVGCAWADYDNDGFVDIILINEGSANALFHNDGAGSFTKVTNTILTNSPFSQAAEWGDYDNDGRSDLFIANYQNNRSFLYHNEGGGNFTRITNGTLVTDAGKFSGAAWGDYDNDGFLDLFVRTYGPNNALYHNNRDGTFTKVTASVITTDASHSYAAVWGDYDNDGWLDLFVSNG